jgi:hypothetical protein
MDSFQKLDLGIFENSPYGLWLSKTTAMECAFCEVLRYFTGDLHTVPKTRYVAICIGFSQIIRYLMIVSIVSISRDNNSGPESDHSLTRQPRILRRIRRRTNKPNHTRNPVFTKSESSF